MKLFYTPNSPYARIARVTALELNLGDRIYFCYLFGDIAILNHS